MQGVDGRHNGMVSTQCTGIVPPCTRPTGMEESDLVNGWPQRALTLWDMMMMMMMMIILYFSIIETVAVLFIQLLFSTSISIYHLTRIQNAFDQQKN